MSHLNPFAIATQTPMIIYPQSAVIPYRIRKDRIEVLLVTSRQRKRWVIPKGLLEPDLTPSESAVKEAWEEAGIQGQVGDRAIGTYEYHKWGGICQVEVFLMQVETIWDDWPEANMRSRQWFGLQPAAKQVREEKLQQMIASLTEWIVLDLSDFKP